MPAASMPRQRRCEMVSATGVSGRGCARSLGTGRAAHNPRDRATGPDDPDSLRLDDGGMPAESESGVARGAAEQFRSLPALAGSGRLCRCSDRSPAPELIQCQRVLTTKRDEENAGGKSYAG